MNVNNNVITYTKPTKIETQKQPARKEEFKKALDDQTRKSKSSSNDDVNKTNNKDEKLNEAKTDNLDETKTESLDETNKGNQSENVEKSPAEESLVPLKQNSEKVTKDIAGDADTGSEVSTEITNTITEIVNALNQNIDKLPKDSIKDVGIKINNVLKKIIDLLKQNINKTSGEEVITNKSTDEMVQIQQLLQSLTSILQSINKSMDTKTSGTELNSINLEELIDTKSLTTETKSTLKNNLSEIVSLLEKSKGNTKVSPEILGLLQKLTTQVKETTDLNVATEGKDTKSELNLLKVPTLETDNDDGEDKAIKDNLLKMVRSQSTKTTSSSISKNQNQGFSDNKKDNKSSGNSATEEKFLNKLLSEDKDDVKITKAVNFMNQFQTVKTSETTKVLNANLVVNKNNFEADVIKSVKFMEINNIKDLTVKMNPRELGEITIKLTMESGIMKASILAQNKETYNLLNSNVQDIQDRLKNMDIKIQSLDINIYEDSTFFNKNSNGNNNNGNEKQDNNSKINRAIDDDIVISDNFALENNQVNEFV